MSYQSRGAVIDRLLHELGHPVVSAVWHYPADVVVSIDQKLSGIEWQAGDKRWRAELIREELPITLIGPVMEVELA